MLSKLTASLLAPLNGAALPFSFLYATILLVAALTALKLVLNVAWFAWFMVRPGKNLKKVRGPVFLLDCIHTSLWRQWVCLISIEYGVLTCLLLGCTRTVRFVGRSDGCHRWHWSGHGHRAG